MNKRAVLTSLLAVAAIGLGVVAVPRAILKWRVYRVATDRQALLEALVAPEDSGEWRAVTTYAETLEGEARLRREFAVEMLRIGMFAGLVPRDEFIDSFEAEIARSFLLVEQQDRVESVLWIAWKHEPLENDTRTLYSARRSSDGVMGVRGFIPFTMGRGFTFRRSEMERFARVVKPSAKPVAASSDVTAYVLRVGNPIVPAAVRKEAADPETLVLYARRGSTDARQSADPPDSD